MVIYMCSAKHLKTSLVNLDLTILMDKKVHGVSEELTFESLTILHYAIKLNTQFVQSSNGAERTVFWEEWKIQKLINY